MGNISDIEKLRIILALIAAVGIIGVIIGFPFNKILLVINWLLSIFVGIIFSLIASSLIKAATGNLLTRYVLLPIKIDGMDFSITLFGIATLTVRELLLGEINPFKLFSMLW